MEGAGFSAGPRMDVLGLLPIQRISVSLPMSATQLTQSERTVRSAVGLLDKKERKGGTRDDRAAIIQMIGHLRNVQFRLTLLLAVTKP